MAVDIGHLARIGNLTERVTIQQNTTTADTHGGRSSSWGTLATVWAHVQGLSGSEVLRAEAVAAGMRYVVTIYARNDVTAKMRLAWTPSHDSDNAQRTLEILAPPRFVGDRLFMELDCGELS